MDKWILFSLVIFGTLVLLALIWLYKRRKAKERGEVLEPKYRELFFLGITFTGVGVAIATSTGNPGLYGITALGIIYMAIGIANRDKWQDKEN